MSTKLSPINDISVSEFWGGPKGPMLQLTQGFGGFASMKQLGEDEPGYVQLTRNDARELASALNTWLDK